MRYYYLNFYDFFKEQNEYVGFITTFPNIKYHSNNKKIVLVSQYEIFWKNNRISNEEIDRTMLPGVFKGRVFDSQNEKDARKLIKWFMEHRDS